MKKINLVEAYKICFKELRGLSDEEVLRVIGPLTDHIILGGI